LDAVPAEPVAPPYSLDDAQKYVIQSGDSLSVISDKFGVSIADIKAANNISNVNKIRAGQTLLLPGEPAAAEPEPAEQGGGEAAPEIGDSSALELPSIGTGS
jgi:membrane-bound lytic murein transglycosylase D